MSDERRAAVDWRYRPRTKVSNHRTICQAIRRQSPGYESIQNAILLIFTQFREQFTLEAVLAEAHMSKANFSRRFISYTGRTNTEFLNEVCQRLAETCDGVTVSALAVKSIRRRVSASKRHVVGGPGD
jgi:transcriptional regulator GlxA family with amidase domain